MAERTPCCIPGCRRTCGETFIEWVCHRHWGTVPRKDRALYNKARRRYEKGGVHKHRRLVALMWMRCKTYAINEALGIGNA